MKGESKNRPLACEMLTGGLSIKYQLRWNIAQAQKTNPETGEEETVYTYEYNSVYQPARLTKKEIMLALIRERYDVDDEIELAMNRVEDVAARLEHEKYVAFAREVAEEVLGE